MCFQTHCEVVVVVTTVVTSTVGGGTAGSVCGTHTHTHTQSKSHTHTHTHTSQQLFPSRSHSVVGGVGDDNEKTRDESIKRLLKMSAKILRKMLKDRRQSTSGKKLVLARRIFDYDSSV